MLPRPEACPPGVAQRSPRQPPSARGEARHDFAQARSPRVHPQPQQPVVVQQRSGGFVAGLLSPRLSPRAPTRSDAKPVTLSNIGAAIPRPRQQLSATGAPRPQGATQPAGDVTARDTSSGIVYECDGFELFYGVKAGHDQPIAACKVKPDGYDKFYGIRSADKQLVPRRAPAEPAAAVRATEAAREPVQSQPQIRVQAGYPTNRAVPGVPFRPAMDRAAAPQTPRIGAPPPVTGGASRLPLPHHVPTYSVSTPVPSFAPPAQPLPPGVDAFSVATPGVPPPSKPLAQGP